MLSLFIIKKDDFMKCWCNHPQARNFGLLALRLAVGAVFIYHGWLKLADMPMAIEMFSGMGIPAAAFFAWLVALIEFVGGLAMVLGVCVKTFSLLLALVMLIALFLVHTSLPYASAELPIMLLGATLALHGTGAGEWRLMKNECACEAKCKK